MVFTGAPDSLNVPVVAGTLVDLATHPSETVTARAATTIIADRGAVQIPPESAPGAATVDRVRGRGGDRVRSRDSVQTANADENTRERQNLKPAYEKKSVPS